MHYSVIICYPNVWATKYNLQLSLQSMLPLVIAVIDPALMSPKPLHRRLSLMVWNQSRLQSLPAPLVLMRGSGARHRLRALCIRDAHSAGASSLCRWCEISSPPHTEDSPQWAVILSLSLTCARADCSNATLRRTAAAMETERASVPVRTVNTRGCASTCLLNL